tara:strand:+ start:1106 stop:1282 length:177 start_codon:yes stop_codon:yes gene_type:complete
MIKSLHELANKFPNKSYKELDKLRLKQDIINSVVQVEGKRKYGDLVENIIKRKMSEKK